MGFAVLIIMALGIVQSDRLSCYSNSDAVTCRTQTGEIYVERRLGSQIIRAGTASDGSSWTEKVFPVGDGWQMVGADSRGRTWGQTCSPVSGLRGSDRNGKSVFIAPSQTRPTERDAFGTDRRDQRLCS
jgi:hypothetical protein